jgi:hypothetical protein
MRQRRALRQFTLKFLVSFFWVWGGFLLLFIFRTKHPILYWVFVQSCSFFITKLYCGFPLVIGEGSTGLLSAMSPDSFGNVPISAGQSSLDSAEDFRRCLDSLEGDENEVNSALPSSDPAVNAEEAPTQHEQKREVPSSSAPHRTEEEKRLENRIEAVLHKHLKKFCERKSVVGAFPELDFSNFDFDALARQLARDNLDVECKSTTDLELLLENLKTVNDSSSLLRNFLANLNHEALWDKALSHRRS